MLQARDPNAIATARALSSRFAGNFKALLTTVHTMQPREIAGKSSNENWAVRCAKARLVDGVGLKPGVERIALARIMITTCDCDSYFHPNHFEALSAEFVSLSAGTRQGRHETFWQPATCFYPNIDEVPWLCSTR